GAEPEPEQYKIPGGSESFRPVFTFFYSRPLYNSGRRAGKSGSFSRAARTWLKSRLTTAMVSSVPASYMISPHGYVTIEGAWESKHFFPLAADTPAIKS
ncbi:MAG: hypothetical protein LBH21_03495, partial [Gracilibacteraceae bacterium]|nr:hypothetical protein [Gracilibacteraceae bacterium]